MKPLLVAVLLSFALPAHAGNVITTLERGARMAKNPRGNELFIRGKRINLTLRSDGGEHNTGVIGVNRTFSQHGYFLGRDGKLSAADSKALEADLASDRSLTRENIVLGVRSSLSAVRAETRRLARADRWIDSMLVTLKDTKPRVLERGKKGELSFERSGSGAPMLVVTKKYSQRAIFLGGDAERGYSLSSGDRAEIADIMLAPR